MSRKTVVLLLWIAIYIPQVLFADENLPARIISLAPSLTHEIYELGAQSMLVGVTVFRPECAGSKEIVGNLTQLNYEKILALAPDLILMSKDSNTQRDVAMLKALGMRIEVFDACEDLDCICAEFISLATLIGRQNHAQRIVDEVKGEVSGLQQYLSGRKTLRIFWQISENPLISATDATFVGDFIRFAGCSNIFGDMLNRYPRVNIETVIRLNPEVIIIVSPMASSSEDVSSLWQNFQEIDAVRDGRIYQIPADVVCRPTPLMFLKGLKTVVETLYPGVL